MKHVMKWFTDYDTFTVTFIDNNFDLEEHLDTLLLQKLSFAVNVVDLSLTTCFFSCVFIAFETFSLMHIL